MPERKRGEPRSRGIKFRFEFVNLGEREAPKLKVDLIDPKTKRQALEPLTDGEFELDERLVGKDYALEVRSAAGGRPRLFAYDSFVSSVRKTNVFRVPEGTWLDWLGVTVCVTGRVEVCHPVFRIPIDLIAADVRLGRTDGLLDLLRRPLLWDPLIVWPVVCNPVCNGKVEVFLRTCCCEPLVIDPPVIIRDLCEIIDCRFPWPPEPWPPWPWPPDGPEPPGPPPPFTLSAQRLGSEGNPRYCSDAVPDLEQAVVRALQRAATVEGAPAADKVLEAAQHLLALQRLRTREAQVRYIESIPELRFRFCTCTTTKVAEVPLQLDGSFDACFLVSLLLRAGCTRHVQYVVSQLQETGWVVVYDGLARGQSFALDEEAVLRADPVAEGCDDSPFVDRPRPFVLLERIGATWADKLIRSTEQDGETSFAGPLAVKDGLVNEAPPGPLDPASGPYDQPWAKMLAQRYQFHPGLEDPAIDAKYYRTRVIPVNANGDPTGPGFTLMGNLSWRKYYQKPDLSPGVRWVALHNPVINGLEGLYTIPYPDLVWPWLGGQFHARVDTTGLANGRYLLVVDIFNASGVRLVPDNSLDAAGPGDIARPFDYLRLEGPIDAPTQALSVVRRNALANLFLVDNLACVADIEAISHNSGPPSVQNCQFLEGPGTDTVAIQYTARHQNNYQWYHHMWLKQGLTGPTTFLNLTGPPSNQTRRSDNVINGLTHPASFVSLLLAEPRCSFAVHLRTYARHTNGSGRIIEYDGHDSGAFALEISS
jgi:hypothetical protein